MKKIFAFCLIIFSHFFSIGQKSEKTTIIEGKIENLANTKIYLEYFDYFNNPVIDSTTVSNDGLFRFNSIITEYGFYRIVHNQSKILIVVNPGSKINVTLNTNDPFGIKNVKGSDEIKQMIDFKKIDDFYKSILDSIHQVFQQNNEKGITQYNQSLQSSFMKAEKDKFEEFALLVKKKPNLLSNLIIIEHLPFNNYFWAYDTVYTLLEPKFNENVFIKELRKKVVSEKNIKVGQIAPEILLPDTSGKILNLTSLRGKYVLIDFWASWCRPCRVEKPALVQIYNKYKDKGFEIYAVSLDRSRSHWIAAINKDNLSWKHVSDLKYWESEVSALYGVKGIPFAVLLDREGKIIHKAIRVNELDKVLEELFNAN